MGKAGCFRRLAHLFRCAGARSGYRNIGHKRYIDYGDSYRRKTIKIKNYLTRARQTIDAVEGLTRVYNPPTLVLNRYCAVCDSQQRCRGVATQLDDLSLLTSMIAKDRAKCAAKGILTITQLSYG